MMTALLVGFVSECLVQAYAIIGAKGRLDSFRPGVDMDHKDLIFDVVGGFRNLYLQVKSTTRLGFGNRVQCMVRASADAVPSDPLFIYVFCLLDLEKMDIVRLWLVPSPDFNRLALRSFEASGKLDLSFSCNVNGDPKWDRYEVSKLTLGLRLLEMMESAAESKGIEGLDLGGLLIVRGSKAA
ncbi:MAG: hypothetical protein ABI401_10625 [Candidatus Dormibacter sp.]